MRAGPWTARSSQGSVTGSPARPSADADVSQGAASSALRSACPYGAGCLSQRAGVALFIQSLLLGLLTDVVKILGTVRLGGGTEKQATRGPGGNGRRDKGHAY